jgi:hypothetical protein
MKALEHSTYSRHSEAEGDNTYYRSYRVIRLAVGFLGVALPAILIIGEAFFLGGRFHFQGSLSAYYHTSMQDFFVGGLCIIGFLLSTYMAGELRSWDFWISLVAGIAVLGVVYFPTSRPDLRPGAPACGSHPGPAGCSFVEQMLGEHTTAVIHVVCAVVFVVSLAGMSFLFAASEVLPKSQRTTASGQRRPRLFRNRAHFLIQGTCAITIVMAGAWAFTGVDAGPLTSLYLGEVAAVWAFGTSWLLAGFYLYRPGPHM